MTEVREHVRQHMKARRGHLGLMTQQDLAKAAGVSLNTVNRLETGKLVGIAHQARVEDALQWERGAIRALFLGEEPTELIVPAGNQNDPVDEEAVGEPDPTDYPTDLDYLNAVYWYLRKQGMSHAAVMRGFRLASAVYLRQMKEHGPDGTGDE